jgi:titin
MKTGHEFGVVTLDIDSVRSSDVGIYTCKAVNLNGEATSTTSIRVRGEYTQASNPSIILLLKIESS